MSNSLSVKSQRRGRVQSHGRISKRRLLKLEQLEQRNLLTVLINEVMPDNGSSLTDGDGNNSDWIEFLNSGPQVDLAGWHLTDDPNNLTQWTFPSTLVDEGEFLTVFASGTGVPDTTGNLHTNFSLSASGEYLALIEPDGTTVHSEFTPQFPALPEDASYGLGTHDAVELATTDSASTFHVPGDSSLSTLWTSETFDDSGAEWSVVTASVGFDVNAQEALIQQWDFENGDLDGFQTVFGAAFDNQPTFGDNPNARGWPVSNVQGNFFVGTYENRPTSNDPIAGVQGDGPTGVVETDSFVVAQDARLEFWIGAGNHPWNAAWDPDSVIGVGNFVGINLEREVAAGDWEMLQTATGAATEVMSEVVWDLTAHAGETVRLRLYDLNSGGWGHPNFDDIRYFGIDKSFATDVESLMHNQNATGYLRIPFDVPDVTATHDTLIFDVSYDDGFVAYINGARVADRNSPAIAAWNDSATAEASAVESIDLSAAIPSLNVNGANVLAIQLLNFDASNEDARLDAELTLESSATRLRYFPVPTPGEANNEGVAGFVSDTSFSVDRGFYTSGFDVELSTLDQDATIRYTLDGSPPTATTGQLYAGPITISTTTALRAAAFKDDFEASNVDTHSYVFLNDVIDQPADPAGFPTNWNNYNIGPTASLVPADYEMSPAIVASHADTIIDDLLSLPTLSIVTDVDDLFGSAEGVYPNPFMTGEGREKTVSVEWIEENGQREFQLDAGLRITGGWSRHFWATPKKSFSLRFRRDHGGPPKLNFPVFDGNQADSLVQPAEQFEILNLRGVFSDAWPDAANSPQYLRDLNTRYSQLAMGQPSSHGTWVHLYLNGLYWGIYNPSERPDASFAASYGGGDESEYDAIKHAGLCAPGCAVNNQYEVVDGDNVAWQSALSLAASGLSGDVEYEQFKQLVDVENLADYIILNHYVGNVDWPHKNWYATRKREAGAGFKFYAWDSEYTLANVNTNRLGVNNANTPAALYNAARQNADFVRTFGDRVHKHLFNDGALQPAANIARYTELANHIEQAIRAESARWGDNGGTRKGATNFTYAGNWVPTRDGIIDNYFPNRHDIALNQLQSAGLYPALAAPTFSQHGGVVPVLYDLTIASAPGTIYYTTDGTDPYDDGVSAGALEYTGPITIGENTRVQARLFSGGQWSALTAADFAVDFVEPLRITELMYNPTNSDDTEYIEVQNIGDDPLQLGGMQINSGVTFEFPAMELAPGATTLIVRDIAAFTSKYGVVPSIAGQYVGQLSNSGEAIRLVDDFGQTILDFEYKDSWYPITDGLSFSLVIVNPLAEPSTWGDRLSWRPSGDLEGSPGNVDVTALPLPGDIVINEVQTHTDVAPGDWIELHNTTNDPIDIEHWFITDDSENPQSGHQISLPLTIPANDYIVLNEDDHFGVLADPVSGFGISELGDEVSLVAAMDDGELMGFQVVQDFGAAENGVPFGRYTTSESRVVFVSLVAPTSAAANALPLVGPVVINEMMYNPAEGGDEFVELHNITSNAVPLYDPANLQNTWSFSNGIDFTIPVGIDLPANGYLLVVPIDPEQFRTTHGLPAELMILGPYIGSLSNGGEAVELTKPGMPEPDGFVPQILVDRIRFRDTAPWPLDADGLGASLERIVSTEYGNDPINWMEGSFGGSPGALNIGIDTTPPSAPQLDSLVVSNSTSVSVSWFAATDAESGIGSYDVFRNAVLIGSTAGDDLAFIDTGFVAGDDTRYSVSAVNGDGVEGPLSEIGVVRTLQDGIGPSGSFNGTSDTQLTESAATSNFGSSVTLRADTDDPEGSDQDSVILLRWDTNVISASTIVDSVSVTLDLGSPAGVSYELYQIQRPWIEGEATWLQSVSDQSWEVAGAEGASDRGTTLLGTLGPAGNGQQTMVLNDAGRDLVQAWIDGGVENNGVILVSPDDGAGGPADTLENLIAFYDFDENVGGQAIDSSGNGLDGQISNASVEANGFDGGAFRFNGSAHVVAPIDINPAALPRFTMGAWVNSDQVNSGLYKILGHDNGGWDRTVGLDNRGTGGFRWTSFIGNGNPVPNTPAPVFGQWTFIAAAYDNTAGTVTVYVDVDANTTVDAVESFTNPTGFNPGQSSVAIGNLRPDDFAEGFRGMMDNVFFFNETLNAGEIQELRDLGESFFASSGMQIDSSETVVATARPRLNFTTRDTPFPAVANVAINAERVDPAPLPKGPAPTTWERQRSSIESVTINFSKAVTATAGDFQLTNLGVNAPVDADSAFTLDASHVTVDGSTVTLQFANGELAEGVYRLDIADSVTDSGGNALDGDDDGNPGGTYSFVGDTDNGFYVLLAEWSGDEGVSVFDFSTFSYWFGLSVPTAPAYVDVSLDGGVSVFDFSAFSSNFGRAVLFPTAFAAHQASSTAMADLLDPSDDIGAKDPTDKLENVALQRRELMFDWNQRRADTRVNQVDSLIANWAMEYSDLLEVDEQFGLVF
jgi:hypothetical protein